MTDAATETQPQKKSSSNIILWLLTWIAILGLASYVIWQKENTDHTESAHMIALVDTLSAQEKVLNTLTDLAETHDEQFEQIAQHSNETVKMIKLLSQQVSPDDQTYRLIKIETYIDQGVIEAGIMQDPITAAKLFSAAAYQIKQLNDPQLAPLANALKQDIQALMSAQQTDKTTLVTALNTVISQVPNFPQKVKGPETIPKPEVSAKVTWQDNLKNTWKELKSLVQVRRYDETASARISPDQHYVINENLQLILQQAIFAAINNKQGLFTQQLQTAMNWLKKYYDTNEAVVSDTIAFLQKLSEQKIAPQMPEKLNTLEIWKNITKSAPTSEAS